MLHRGLDAACTSSAELPAWFDPTAKLREPDAEVAQAKNCDEARALAGEQPVAARGIDPHRRNCLRRS